MPNDIKLSTILLFVTVAFLIWCLMYSNDGFSNIENVTENVTESVTENEIVTENEPETNQKNCEQNQFEQNQFEQNQFEQ